jgi:hypothetical protein
MENVHAERSAGYAIISFVALIVIATVITSPLPSPTLRAPDIGLLLDLHRTTLLWGAWLTFPASAFFLWFIVGLRTYLSHAPGRQEGLSMFALVAGVVMVGLSLVAACFETTVAYAPADVFQSYSMAGLYDAFIFLQGGLAYGPAAIFIFAVASSMRRHESAPEWLVWLGYVAAAGAGIATLSIFFREGFMAPSGSGPGVFGALPTAVWLVAIGLELIKRRPVPAAEDVVPIQ